MTNTENAGFISGLFRSLWLGSSASYDTEISKYPFGTPNYFRDFFLYHWHREEVVVLIEKEMRTKNVKKNVVRGHSKAYGIMKGKLFGVGKERKVYYLDESQREALDPYAFWTDHSETKFTRFDVSEALESPDSWYRLFPLSSNVVEQMQKTMKESRQKWRESLYPPRPRHESFDTPYHESFDTPYHEPEYPLMVDGSFSITCNGVTTSYGVYAKAELIGSMIRVRETNHYGHLLRLDWYPVEGTSLKVRGSGRPD